MKKLFEEKVSHPDEPFDGEQSNLMGLLLDLAHDETTASRAFIMDEHEVKEWIIAGRLERVLDSFLAGHELPNKKKKRSVSDLSYKLGDGLYLRAFQVPPDDISGETEKFVLSLRLEGIDGRNTDRARAIFADLKGIPV
jgi:hypothetical protein